jgi:hypothetical protein
MFIGVDSRSSAAGFQFGFVFLALFEAACGFDPAFI